MVTSVRSITEYPEVLNARNVAAYPGIGYAKALNLLKYGNVPCVRIGNTFRVSKKVFENWLNEPAQRNVLQKTA